MTKPVTVPTLFANLNNATGPQLDSDFASILTALNDPATYNNYLVDSGGTLNAYVVAFPAGIGISSYVAGLQLQIFTTRTNTGAITVNVNGLGVRSVVNQGGSAVASGQIIANSIFVVQYDGTNFEILSPIVAAFATNATNATNVTAGGTVTTNAVSGTTGTFTDTITRLSAASNGVVGTSTVNIGVSGNSGSNYGVYGNSTSSVGVYGNSGSNIGVYGNGTNGIGVSGNSGSNYGVYGNSTSSVGVAGISTSNIGVKGTTLGTTTYTVGTLPIPSANFTSARAFITDQNGIPAWGNAPTGGGALKYPVWCDGVGWFIG